jgi:hypothetical protein
MDIFDAAAGFQPGFYSVNILGLWLEVGMDLVSRQMVATPPKLALMKPGFDSGKTGIFECNGEGDFVSRGGVVVE